MLKKGFFRISSDWNTVEEREKKLEAPCFISRGKDKVLRAIEVNSLKWLNWNLITQIKRNSVSPKHNCNLFNYITLHILTFKSGLKYLKLIKMNICMFFPRAFIVFILLFSFTLNSTYTNFDHPEEIHWFANFANFWLLLIEPRWWDITISWMVQIYQ